MSHLSASQWLMVKIPFKAKIMFWLPADVALDGDISCHVKMTGMTDDRHGTVHFSHWVQMPKNIIIYYLSIHLMVVIKIL